MGLHERRRGRLSASSGGWIALALAFFVVVGLRLTDRRWLLAWLEAVAGPGSDGFWVGVVCAFAWIAVVPVILLLNRLLRRLTGGDRLPVSLVLSVFSGLGALAVLTAPQPRYPRDWDRNVEEALPRFFDGWLVGSAPLLVLGTVLLLRDLVRRRRARSSAGRR